MKQNIPIILEKLQNNSWRVRVQSVRLLGAMSQCASKQLSAALPKIVPPLNKVLLDANSKVSEAARDVTYFSFYIFFRTKFYHKFFCVHGITMCLIVTTQTLLGNQKTKTRFFPNPY